MSRCTDAVAAFASGFSCSQAVIAPFCEQYGLDKNTALKLSAPLGGGAKCGELCGAVSGALLVVGLKDGFTDATDAAGRSNTDEKTKKFLQLFRERNTSVVCRELLKTAAAAATGDDKKDFKRRHCTRMVSDAAQILEDLGY